MIERIIITYNEDGTARGASTQDFDGLPVAVDDLAGFQPQLAAALDSANVARITELETQLSESQGNPVSGGVTKLTIKRRLDVLGKWETFKYVLSQLPETVQDEWLLAQEISQTDPVFIQNTEALKAALTLTDEEYDSLFD